MTSDSTRGFESNNRTSPRSMDESVYAIRLRGDHPRVCPRSPDRVRSRHPAAATDDFNRSSTNRRYQPPPGGSARCWEASEAVR